MYRFTEEGDKVKKFIRFPAVIQADKFVHPQAKCAHQSVKYQLISVITHVGNNSSGGHYTATAQCADLQFRRFNDTQVLLASWS